MKSYGSLQPEHCYSPCGEMREKDDDFNKSSARKQNRTSWRQISALALVSAAIISLIGARHSFNFIASNEQTPSLNSVMYGYVQSEKEKFADDVLLNIEKLFESFKLVYNRQYKTEDEERLRFDAFKKNIATINKMNAANPFAFYGINHFADITEDESQSMRMSKPFSDYESIISHVPKDIIDTAPYENSSKSRGKLNQRGQNSVNMADLQGEVKWISDKDCAACKMYPELEKYNLKNMPPSFDWRTKYHIPVGNQGYCGSCWTYSCAGDVEGKWFLATGESIELSKQQLVACDQSLNEAEGCNGGYPLQALQYIENTGGLAYERDYPYKMICAGCNGEYSGTPTCDKERVTRSLKTESVAHVGGFQMIAFGPEYESLMATALVKNGPISISLNANGMEYYVSGIADNVSGCDPNVLDHAVLLVGFGEENGIPYWIIKNSWSNKWGEEGYFRAIRGKNYCGLSNFAVTSVVKMP